MRTQDRALARKQLDKRFKKLGNPDLYARPTKGWMRAIREALGMTTAQVASRLGVSQPRAVEIEKAEMTQAITLETLDRAARALDCRLVYAFVPRKPLDELVAERARKLARRRLSATRHSMALEDQSVAGDGDDEQMEQLVRQFIDKAGSKLWEDE
jgi:predicted DNA-binding mobile mystery protein A